MMKPEGKRKEKKERRKNRKGKERQGKHRNCPNREAPKTGKTHLPNRDRSPRCTNLDREFDSLRMCQASQGGKEEREKK